MNPMFSNFNFDKWLLHFVQVLYMIDSRNGDFMAHESPCEIKKDKFFNQDHGNFDEYSEDLADSYLNDITKFNCFMKWAMSGNRNRKDFILFLLALQFPNIKNLEHIYNILNIKKSYRTSDGVLFTPSILSHVDTFINNISSDNNYNDN